MVQVYTETSYQKIISKAIETLRVKDKDRSFKDLAKYMRIEHSYLSKVIHQKAHFNSDQLFLACKYLGLDDEEQEYMSLLLERDRCYIAARKIQLNVRIRKFRLRGRQTEKALQIAETVRDADLSLLRVYYECPMHQIVHICLGLERYASDRTLLARDLQIPTDMMDRIVDQLRVMRLIAIENGIVRLQKREMHLARDTSVFMQWSQQMRLLALQKTTLNPTPDNYAFSVVFNCDDSTRVEIKERFFSFLRDVEVLVKGAKRERTLQINFDFFPWVP